MKLKNNITHLVKEPVLLISVLIIFILLFFFILYPILIAGKLSLFPEGTFTFDVYKHIFQNERFRVAITNSIILGLIVATSSTLIGFIFAYSQTRAKILGRKIFKVVALLPLVSPPFMFALSVILLFGRNGLITAGLLDIDRFNIYGLPGLVIVQTIGMFPIAYLALVGVLQAIDPDIETCAMNLGAKRFKTFISVTLPLAMPGIFAAWLLVFATSLTDFGNPMVIGGDFDVMSTLAYLEFTGMNNFPRGTALAILLLIPTLAIYIFQKYYLSKKSFTTITGKLSRRVIVASSPFANKLMFILCSLITIIILLFYLTIIVGSFVKLWGVNWSFTLDHFIYSYDVGMKAIIDTVVLALVATPITALLGMIIAFLVMRKQFPGKHLMEFSAMISYAIPGTVVGIGYILAFNKSPFLFTGTAFILIACFIFREVPVGIESGVAALKQISKDIEESSTNLGANSLYTFKRVTLPLITPSLFAGATFAFVRCMTAISAIIFLVSARWNHITVLILAQTEIMRLGAASVLSFMLIIIVMAGIYFIRKITGQNQEKMFGA